MRQMNTVIFDMDGLMFDTERVFIAAWDYVKNGHWKSWIYDTENIRNEHRYVS